MRLQKVGHNWATNTFTASLTCCISQDEDHTVFLPVGPGSAGRLAFCKYTFFFFLERMDGCIVLRELKFQVYRNKAIISDNLNITKLSYPKGKISLLMQSSVSKLD